jgi:D-alanyl-D-alanine carboxypeptidase
VLGSFLGRRWLSVLIVGVLTVASAGCGAPSIAPVAMQPSPSASLPPATLAPAITATSPAPTALPTIAASPTTATLRTVADQGHTGATATAALDATALATATPQASPKSIDPALAAELQEILNQIVGDGSIPGAVLAVHIPGQVPWTGASGFVDRQRSQPIEPTTEMRIASISKVFTAVVVLQLVEEGKVDLDTPLTNWFPQLVPDAEHTTVRNLLNHTTGLYDYLEDKHFLAHAYQQPEHRWAPDELVAYAAQHPSAFRPGTHGAWDYSSTNYVILGMIVEQVTGNSLAQEMHARIFAPLELEHTFFPPDDTVQGVPARGYRQTYDQTNISLSFAFATANLVSTVGDVQRFGEALFGGRLLKATTLDIMFTFENGKGQYNMPKLEYGLGVMRNQLPIGPNPHGQARPAAESTVLGHTGGFGGFRSALWYAPESGITIALGMNQGATDPNILATRALQAILASQGR